MSAADHFAMVRCDELWVGGVLEESRLNYGQAIAHGLEIFARNMIEDRALDARLREACSAEIGRMRRTTSVMRDAHVRGVVTASTEEVESTVAITIDGVSVVTTAEAALTEDESLKRLLQPPTRHPLPTTRLPIVWRNGSAAVLLHEAIGHAAEHGHKPLPWPSWLRARDVTRAGRAADVVAGEMPVAVRRESFRDVPMRRMTSLIIEQNGAPFEVPRERIEIHLVAGGAYEPLTEMVTINVAIADVISDASTVRCSPFTIRRSRLEISRALFGATGDPIRYPGVICSREGQELFVASHAPVMISAELR